MMETNPKIKVLSTVPFRFKDVHHCKAIVGMPMNYEFSREIIQFVEVSLAIDSFDIVGISSFAKNITEESETLLSSLNIASVNHSVENVFIFKHMDSGKHYQEKRFPNSFEEDYHHKRSLLSASKKINHHYPHIKVRLFYVRIVSDGTELEFSEFFPNKPERVRLVTTYKFSEKSVGAAVVMCQDWRFRRESRVCVRDSLKEEAFELIALPGASKSFHGGCNLAKNSIDVAINTHGCEKIIIIHHADCGAYGGSCSFASAEAEEKNFYNELKKFDKEIKELYPNINVIMVYARLINDGTQIQFVQYLD